MRTFGALRDAAPAPDEAERLSDRQLHAATANPDHSEAGRRAAGEALRARGFEPQHWRVRVPSFIDLADLARCKMLFFGWNHRARIASLTLVSLLLLASACSVVLQRIEFAGPLLLAALGWGIVWVLAAAFRPKPARIVVVARPLPRRFAVSLRRMIHRELRPFGHIMAMAQRPGVVESAVVSNARDYRRLARRLHDRLGQNLRAMITNAVTLPVLANRRWRRMTQELLLDSADAIVVDMSCLRETSFAELALLREAGIEQRIVFVAIWGWVERAEAALRGAGLSQTCFAYAPDGEMQHRNGFRDAMLEAMLASQEARPSPVRLAAEAGM